MADGIDYEDLGPVRAALTEVIPQMPGMPADFWEDVELLLLAWHRNQRWRMVDITSASVARYAQLLASFSARSPATSTPPA